MMAAAFWHSSESVAAWACTQPQWQAHAQAGTQAAIAVAAHMAHLSARPWKFKSPVQGEFFFVSGLLLVQADSEARCWH
jgi:hypothetical protein